MWWAQANEMHIGHLFWPSQWMDYANKHGIEAAEIAIIAAVQKEMPGASDEEVMQVLRTGCFPTNGH